MARISTPGIWLPGPLNTLNSVSPTGQADIAGNPYYMGMNPGKMIVLATSEAQNAAAPGTKLYDGAYQVVQLDSSATAANALAGMPAFILLDSGATQGALPQTAYDVPTVTTADVANVDSGASLFCGVFINPATVNGAPNGPTPGNFTMLFVGGGRAVTKNEATSVLGQPVWPSAAGAATFQTDVTAPTDGSSFGKTVQPVTGAGTSLTYFPDIMFRFGGF